jgi:hypothetical protein
MTALGVSCCMNMQRGDDTLTRETPVGLTRDQVSCWRRDASLVESQNGAMRKCANRRIGCPNFVGQSLLNLLGLDLLRRDQMAGLEFGD